MSQHAPYYPWFSKDYAADVRVRAMTDDQDLAYRRMLDASWEMGPLPDDPVKLAAIVCYDVERFKLAWTYPLTECWSKQKRRSFILNQRLEEIRERILDKSIKAKESANKRWSEQRKRLGIKEESEKSAVSGRNATASITHMRNDAIQIQRVDANANAYASASQASSSHSDNSTPSSVVERTSAARSPKSATKKHGKPKKKPSTTAGIIRWNPTKKTFDGDRERMRKKVFGRYDDLGGAWIQATWRSCVEWCQDHTDEMETKKDHWLFVLNWFNRDAKGKRQYS